MKHRVILTDVELLLLEKKLLYSSPVFYNQVELDMLYHLQKRFSIIRLRGKQNAEAKAME
jgi:hypothetical protein